MDEVAGRPAGVGQEDRVECGHGGRVAEAVEAGPLERGAAVAVATVDVRLGELPAPVPGAVAQPPDLLVDGLGLGLPLRRDAQRSRFS